MPPIKSATEFIRSLVSPWNRRKRKSGRVASFSSSIEETPGAVCSACRDLHIDDLPAEGHNITTKFGNVQRRAAAGCAACKMIQTAAQHFGVTKDLVGMETRTRKPTIWDIENARGSQGVPYDPTEEVWISESSLDVDIRIAPPDQVCGVDYQTMIVLYGRKEKYLGKQIRSHPIELYRPMCRPLNDPTEPNISSQWPAIGFSPNVVQRSDDQQCMAAADEWLKECMKSHPDCGKRRTNQLPFRILDVSNSTVCLVEGIENSPYVTLSYCWGPATTHRLTTTLANIASHRQGIAWQCLSKTHQDAISVTRTLGFCYIWIDALCIIQDDTKDWSNTAARMADIYENSSLTICATWASNSDGGLFSDRHASRRDIEPSLAKALSTPFLVHKGEPPVFARLVIKQHFCNKEREHATSFDLPAVMDHDPLLTRAWCLQERMLSVRTLSFTLEEIVWECRTVRRCECAEADRGGVQTQAKRVLPFLSAGPLWSSSNDTLDLTDAWQGIISTYSTMSLTYSSDRLPALTGLAHRFGELKGSISAGHDYLAGLWRQDLPKSILWYIRPRPGEIMPVPYGSKCDRDNHSSYHKTRPTVHVPSWSWAAREGQAIFTPMELDEDLKFIDATCTYATDDIYGQCTGGSIIFRGRFASAKLRYNDARSSGYTGSESAFAQDWSKAYWIDQDGIWTYVKADAELADSASDNYVPLNTPVFCLRIGWERLETKEWHGLGKRVSCGLVLRQVPETGQYIRIAKFIKEDDPNKLRIKQRPSPDGIGTEDVIKAEDFFLEAELKTIVIV